MLDFRKCNKRTIEVMVISDGRSANHVADLKNYQFPPEWFLVNISGVIKTDELRQIADKLDELNGVGK